MAIPSSLPSPSETLHDWHAAMRSAVRDSQELKRRLGLGDRLSRDEQSAAESFPVFAPLEFIARMRYGDPDDPLLRQVLAAEQELHPVAGFVSDPVGDEAARLSPGLLRKYDGRALLIATGTCAIHCRYCFRRHYPYGEGPKSTAQWDAAIDLLREDHRIEEVLLSGGDPLTLVDTQLAELIDRIEAVPHVRRLRLHTRLPVVIPQRVTAALIERLRDSPLTSIVVIHANHAAELDEAVRRAVARFVQNGVTVLNQSVLLRGVNDSAPALIALSRRLLEMQVLPYYLHQLDRVDGAAHFEVPIAEGIELVHAMRAHLPGYGVPRYVQEIPGEPCKRVLA